MPREMEGTSGKNPSPLLEQQDALLPTLVFSQSPGPALDLSVLMQHARRHFGLGLEVLVPRSDSSSRETRVRATPAGTQWGRTFLIRGRHATEEDQVRARHAESLSRAAGMARLASRCPVVFEVLSLEGGAPDVLFALCGALASVTLGPILPPDGARLLGVKSAREEAARAGRAH